MILLQFLVRFHEPNRCDIIDSRRIFPKNPMKSVLPFGKRLQNYGESQFAMTKSIISMAIFNNYVTNDRRRVKNIEQ